jgi:hypothetical protein
MIQKEQPDKMTVVQLGKKYTTFHVNQHFIKPSHSIPHTHTLFIWEPF